MQIIINWLNGPQNFTVGATLYKNFGTNEALKNLLAKGETPFAKKLLAEQLEKLALPGAVKPPTPVIEQQVETGEMPAGDGDDILEAIKNEWMPLYQRMNLLRHQLDKYGSSNSEEAIAFRKPIAFEIKHLEKECKGIWKKREYYLKEGKLPFVPETKLEIPTDPIKLAALINNIKRYIRRYKRYMIDNPGEPKYAQFYTEYKSQHLTVTGKEYEEKD